MNPSLATLLITGTQAGSGQSVRHNTINYQQDSKGVLVFGQALDTAYGSLSHTESPTGQELPADAAVLQELHSLPQGGKLLPLLEQALDVAAAAGIEPEQFFERLGARLQDGPPLKDAENPLTAFTTDLQQVLNDLAPSAGVVFEAMVRPISAAYTFTTERKVLADAGDGEQPRDNGYRLSAFTTERNVLADAGDGEEPRDSGYRLSALGNDASVSVAQADKSRLAVTVYRGQSDAGLDKAVLQLQQQSPAVEGGQAEAEVLLAAFKRILSDSRPTGIEGIQRGDHAIVPAMLQTSTQPAAPANANQPTLNLATPFAQAGWEQAMGERVQWMLNHNLQSAQVKLNPEHLGPIEVRVQIQHDQASIQFSAQHVVVREALEAALPRLREMFEASGIELVDVDVSGQSYAERQAAGNQAEVRQDIHNKNIENVPEQLIETSVHHLLEPGRLDLFA